MNGEEESCFCVSHAEMDEKEKASIKSEEDYYYSHDDSFLSFPDEIVMMSFSDDGPFYDDRGRATTTSSSSSPMGFGFLDLLADDQQTHHPTTIPPPEYSDAVNSSGSDSNDDEDEIVDGARNRIKNHHLLKVKKKEGKKAKGKKEPRFAFMTKSDVDHLDDGYRWRKYGQKGVKNSPFPRSYYRCTAASCGVKKRVERSARDKTVVITTYEGTHKHPCPMPRGCLGIFGGGGGRGFPMMPPPPPLPSGFGERERPFCPPPSSSCLERDDRGLLQDMLLLPSEILKQP